MHYYLSTWWRWFRRCGYSRGWRAVSFCLIAFIPYVINEHYPYDAYQELQEQFPQLNRREHKVGTLLYELSNHWQPVIKIVNRHIFDAYLHEVV